MNKIELIQTLKDSNHLSKSESEKIVTLFFDKMADCGITNASIIDKTGFNQKQISNVVLKLKKQGKIKSIGRVVLAGA